jgi:prepilin-type N-terminal cleavage/methylation domain-containing protein/prepilin-type processing-associated H-X9-DG protein
MAAATVNARRGFTLMELLVVLAIVTVLAGLIGGAVEQARAEANSARCVSNLRQWGAALLLYVTDNQGYVPRRGQGVQQLGQINRPTDWFNALPPYLGDQPYQNLVAQNALPQPGQNSIFVCPSATRSGGTYFLPYGMNMYLSQWDQPNPDKLNAIPAPDELAFLADAPGQYSSTVPSALPYSVMARHEGRANVCFADGHVASFDGSYLGCGVGQPSPAAPGIRWQTLIQGDPQTVFP